TMPSKVHKVVTEVQKKLKFPLGIHTHNDCGMGIANAVSAVEAGAGHVQGTINGYGERCGNPDLLVIIANLQLKLGMLCLPAQKLKEFTEAARFVGEVSNMVQAKSQPYVGQSAFAHKGGVHINAVMKNPETYEHIDPALVGNRRRFLVSELGGKTNVMLKARELDIDFQKESPEAKKILQEVQQRENEGYQYEAAEASFELLVRKATGRLKENPFFKVTKASIGHEFIGTDNPTAKAKVSVNVQGQEHTVEETGDGPVNALDKAFRKALIQHYPAIKDIHLDDYKVRIVNSKAGTAAKVRVFIEFRDEKDIWTTVGVSTNIIEASWQALVDAYEYKLLKVKAS
ncbi:MAG TPA: alpha-isopropylmalate synthase regulatory domain-containing protein, partial [Candidatus Omnitrophota bacterium]|nr:alpha-isopropylmalate synthase regulatory domain-containing protein [Candidatus Omnitrophota bacterium]